MKHKGESDRDTRPLRISYLLSQFPLPTEVFAISDIVALREQGHRVIVHTVKPKRRDELTRLRSCNVPGDLVILRPSLAGGLRWPGLLWSMRTEAASLVRRILASAPSAPLRAAVALLCLPRVLEIADEVRKCRSDVVHLFWARHAGMVLPVLSHSAVVRTAFVGAYDLVADDFLVDMALNASNVIFSHAECNRQFAESRAPAGVGVEIIHRGISLTELGKAETRDLDLWVTASALVESKNVEAVLRTFALARCSRPELKLMVFGEGPDRDRLRQCAASLGCSEAVRFMGHVGRNELFAHMTRAGTFILLSKKPSERLPNVVKEALWAGCAVLASNSEGIEELVPDSGIGLVVDPDDPRALSEAVDSVVSETEEQASKRRRRAREHIADRFSSERNMGRYVAAWRAAINSHPVRVLTDANCPATPRSPDGPCDGSGATPKEKAADSG